MKNDVQRCDLLKSAMEQAQLTGLLCCSPTDVLMLTGYWPVMGASLAFALADGTVCAIVPKDEFELASATSDARIVTYEPETLHRLTSPAESIVDPLRQLLNEISLAKGSIGLALDDATVAVPYQAINIFRDAISGVLHSAQPGLTSVSAGETIKRLKGVMTRLEIEQLRRAAGLASAGFAEAECAIVAGRREDEVAADVGAAFDRVANTGFERGLGFFFCMSGPNSATAAGAFAQTRRRVLEQGDLVMIHTNTAGDGYWTDITRTYVVGAPSERQQRMYAAIAEARQAALQAVAPGVSTKLVDAAARDVLTQHGFGAQFKHAAGHGVGFAAADPNAIPRIHPESTDILQPGMTFNIEPAIYFDGYGGMRHCDVIACTEAGAEVLTDF